jgi:hypothetical protein
MEMENGLSCLRSGIDDHPVIVYSQLFRCLLGRGKQVPHQGFVFYFFNGLKMGPGDRQDMDWRLGIEVPENDDAIIFEEEFFMAFAPGYFAKDTITQWLLLCVAIYFIHQLG